MGGGGGGGGGGGVESSLGLNRDKKPVLLHSPPRVMHF